MPVLLAFGNLKEDDCNKYESQVLDYKAKTCLKKKNLNWASNVAMWLSGKDTDAKPKILSSILCSILVGRKIDFQKLFSYIHTHACTYTHTQTM